MDERVELLREIDPFIKLVTRPHGFRKIPNQYF